MIDWFKEKKNRSLDVFGDNICVFDWDLTEKEDETRMKWHQLSVFVPFGSKERLNKPQTVYFPDGIKQTEVTVALKSVPDFEKLLREKMKSFLKRYLGIAVTIVEPFDNHRTR